MKIKLPLNEWIDDIYIFDTHKQVFIKSKIKTPHKGYLGVTVHSNSEKDELTTFGYIHQQPQFSNGQHLPCCLIQLISKYYVNETVFVLDGDNRQHWSINMDYILNNTFE